MGNWLPAMVVGNGWLCRDNKFDDAGDDVVGLEGIPKGVLSLFVAPRMLNLFPRHDVPHHSPIIPLLAVMTALFYMVVVSVKTSSPNQPSSRTLCSKILSRGSQEIKLPSLKESWEIKLGALSRKAGR